MAYRVVVMLIMRICAAAGIWAASSGACHTMVLAMAMLLVGAAASTWIGA